MQKTYNEFDIVRIRNLKITIAKYFISHRDEMNSVFSKQQLKEYFIFKESDFKTIVKDLFVLYKKSYKINGDLIVYLKKVIQSHDKATKYLNDAENQFLKKFGRFYADFKKDPYSLRELYKSTYEDLKSIIPIIHWGRLPVFNKYLLRNRGFDPETETLDFYNHLDCLKALLQDIKNEGEMMQNTSDLHLGQEMPFTVYTRRWGSTDTYQISRTVDGWYCRHISINGKCKKNGEGALFQNLEHDNVFFPRDGVAYAFEKLWEDADEGKIDFNELSNRLQQVADWISEVEKSILKQPEWVTYY